MLSAAGVRAAVDFLKELGISTSVSHRLIDRYGHQTKAYIQRDPFSALRYAGGDFRYVRLLSGMYCASRACLSQEERLACKDRASSVTHAMVGQLSCILSLT